MFYGFVITEAGNQLLAKMVAGQTLKLSGVFMDLGTVEDKETARQLTAPLEPGPAGTSTVPTVKGNQVGMIVQFRSDLDGGLKEDKWIGGFGVYAKDPDTEEPVMIYYASLGHQRQPIAAYVEGTAPDVRNFPISIRVTSGVDATLTYPAGAWMTAEDVLVYFNETIKPQLEASLVGLIEAHNSDENAHPDLAAAVAEALRVAKETLAAAQAADRKAATALTAAREALEDAAEAMTAAETAETAAQDAEQAKKDAQAAATAAAEAKKAAEAAKESAGTAISAKQDALSPDESIVLEGEEIRVALPVKAVTEEEYDGLSEAEKAADVAYLVTDDAPDSPEPPWNRRNLLDNWYFADPLNQRGQTKYTGIGYTIDRWCFGNEKSSDAPTIELLDDCIFIQTNTSDAQYHYFIQRMELDTYRQYRGKTITVSLLAKGVGTLMLYGGYLRADDTYVQKFSMRALSDDYDVYTLTYAIPDDLPSDIKCAELGNFQLANGAGSIYAKAMKVELGDRQTLAHQDAEGNWVLNDPPPDKAAELAKCQRCMYNPLYGASGHYNRLGTGFAIGSKMVLISIPLPTSMRITPAVNWSNLILRDLSNYTSIVGIRSITTDSNSIGAGSVTLLCETINTIASGRSFVLETVHDDALTGTMLLDANL